MKQRLLILLFFFINGYVASAENYQLDAQIRELPLLSGHLKMGHPGVSGKELLLNNRFLTLGGKPFIPVMGEMHFSRVSKNDWEDRLLKMKAAGINVVATYVIWIHHEEEEGVFDWKQNNDLRAFVQLCSKLGLLVYPRIGPWCHGEVRNGGTPDWIYSKKDLVDRSNNPVYQKYAERWYQQIGEQLRGLYYKDGGPVIGIQLENEYRRGPGGNAHILWLKQTAQKYGMDVPVYTVTGWGNASVPQDEVVPLFGDYPEEPWRTDLQYDQTNPAFAFDAPKNSAGIGADVAGKEGKSTVDLSRYPYLTCELGIGNQITYHRRPIISPIDGLAISTVKTGSGSNLPGYYVFTGGLNPTGKLTTMEENQDETGYWNEYPDISYDFQAAIGETGELAPSYHQIRRLHYFLNEFGEMLAPMTPVIPKNQQPLTHLQWSVRTNGNSGFIFGVNYYRNNQKPVQKDVTFDLILNNEHMQFPAVPVSIPDSSVFIWPFNLDLGGIQLKYATVQPLCRTSPESWFFCQNKGIAAEICLDATTISKISHFNGTISQKNGAYILRIPNPDYKNPIEIKTRDGKTITLRILSAEDALHAWFFYTKSRKELYLSNANLVRDSSGIQAYGSENKFSIVSLAGPKLNRAQGWSTSKKYGFNEYNCILKPISCPVNYTHLNLLGKALNIRIPENKITPKNALYRKLYTRKLMIQEADQLTAASFRFKTSHPCRIRINEKWLNQEIDTARINQLDLTGYLKNGENLLLIEYRYSENPGFFAGNLILQKNNKELTTIKTDSTWRCADSYSLPFAGRMPANQKNVELDSVPPDTSVANEWLVSFQNTTATSLPAGYLHIRYNGDIARFYSDQQLLADNFYNGQSWSVQTSRICKAKENRISITPLPKNDRILFEKGFVPEYAPQPTIKAISFTPEYRSGLSISE